METQGGSPYGLIYLCTTVRVLRLNYQIAVQSVGTKVQCTTRELRWLRFGEKKDLTHRLVAFSPAQGSLFFVIFIENSKIQFLERI